MGSGPIQLKLDSLEPFDWILFFGLYSTSSCSGFHLQSAMLQQENSKSEVKSEQIKGWGHRELLNIISDSYHISVNYIPTNVQWL